MISIINIHLLDRSETESEWLRDVFIPSHIITFEAQPYHSRFLVPKYAVSLGPKLLCHTLRAVSPDWNANQQKAEQTFPGHSFPWKTVGEIKIDSLFYPPETVKNFKGTPGKSVLLSF